jgi:SAM-dependent methyltransferase
MVTDQYSGVDNLEAMEAAVRYKGYLGGLLADLSTRVPAGGASLDFGAGTGTYSKIANEVGLNVTCVEPDVSLGARLEDAGFTVTGSTEAIPDSSYDAVFSFNVLEHIQDDAAALGELWRITRPEGHLLLYTPAFMLLYSSMDRLVGHVRRYQRNQLMTLARSAGWTVTRCEYADSLGVPAGLAYRLVGPESGSLNPRSVRLYDRYVFPASRVLDSAFRHLAGKNVVLWAKRGAAT